MNGVKMRVPEIKTYLTLWETLGTRPCRLAWGEIFLGLKTGVVDAAEGPISSAFSAKFHEAAKHVIRTDHSMSSAHITINEKAYQDLRPRAAADRDRRPRKEAVAGHATSRRKETEDAVAQDGGRGRQAAQIDMAPIQAQAQAAVAKMEKDGAWSPACGRRSRTSSSSTGSRTQLLRLAIEGEPRGSQPWLFRCASSSACSMRRACGALARHRPDRHHGGGHHRPGVHALRSSIGRSPGSRSRDLRLHLDGLRRRQRRLEARPAHHDRDLRRASAAAREAASRILVYLIVIAVLWLLVREAGKVMDVESRSTLDLAAVAGAAQLVLFDAARGLVPSRCW